MKKIMLISMLSCLLLSACEQTPVQRQREIGRAGVEMHVIERKVLNGEISRLDAIAQKATLKERLANLYLKDDNINNAAEEFYIAGNFYYNLKNFRKAKTNYEQAIKYGQNATMEYTNKNVAQEAQKKLNTLK